MGVELTPEMILGAQQTEKKYGVPASVTLAQIKLESGGAYAGGLSWLAYKYNNLFGITKSSDWTGGVFSSSGYEYKVYKNVSESIEDHGKLLAKEMYTKNTKDSRTIREYIQGIQKTGYAEDPNYVDKLMNIINRDNLTQYDSGSIPEIINKKNNTNIEETGPDSNINNELKNDSSSEKMHWYGYFIVIVILIICILFGIFFVAKGVDKNRG